MVQSWTMAATLLAGANAQKPQIGAVVEIKLFLIEKLQEHVGPETPHFKSTRANTNSKKNTTDTDT